MTHFRAALTAAEAAMGHDMLVEQIPVAEKILRTAIGYALYLPHDGRPASALTLDSKRPRGDRDQR